jgi:L-cystine uptake protein TcyP (sodium:dicarboxylate symporter family)
MIKAELSRDPVERSRVNFQIQKVSLMACVNPLIDMKFRKGPGASHSSKNMTAPVAFYKALNPKSL